jgi:hypothetical protein
MTSTARKVADEIIRWWNVEMDNSDRLRDRIEAALTVYGARLAAPPGDMETTAVALREARDAEKAAREAADKIGAGKAEQYVAERKAHEVTRARLVVLEKARGEPGPHDGERYDVETPQDKWSREESLARWKSDAVRLRADLRASEQSRSGLATECSNFRAEKDSLVEQFSSALAAEDALVELRDRVEQARASVQAVEGLSHANSVFAGNKMTAIHFYAGKALAALSNTQDPQSLQANQNPDQDDDQKNNVQKRLRDGEIGADRPDQHAKNRNDD